MKGELAEGFEQWRDEISLTFCKHDSGYFVEDKQMIGMQKCKWGTLKEPLWLSQHTFKLFRMSGCHECNPYFQAPNEIALKNSHLPNSIDSLP